MPIKLTTNEFIERSNYRHNYKWDYSLVEYINSRSKVIIICKNHGEFYQNPSDHLNGCGCPKCDSTLRMTTDLFIERSKVVHGDKWNYSKVNYGKNNYDLVSIICSYHGEFDQRPWAHLRGQGCPKCSNNRLLSNSEFINKCKKIHGDKWNYSKVNYLGRRKTITIICKDHGEFDQEARVHLDGWGCKKCSSSKMEDYLSNGLDKISEIYERDKRFVSCKRKISLPFDFYLKNRNILIECDGIQHHKSIDYFGGDERFNYQKENDLIKTNWCLEFGYKLIRLNNLEEIDFFLENLSIKNN